MDTKQKSLSGELLKYLGWILFFACLWIKGCGNGQKVTDSVVVTVPEIHGEFEPKKPIHLPLIVTSGGVSGKECFGVTKTGPNLGNAILIEQMDELICENEQLSRDFYFASDSLKKLKYQKAIQLNMFTETFEDQNIKIDMSGIVRGEVKSIQPFYTIKEREIKTEVKKKEVKFRMLAGGSVGNSIDFQNPVFSANIGFQNQKGGIFRAGFDTDKRILIGYDFSLFKIEK